MSLCRAEGSRGTAGWVPAVGTGSWEAVRPGLGRSSVVLAVFWGFAPVPVFLLPQPWLWGAAGWDCGDRACGWAVAGCDGAGGTPQTAAFRDHSTRLAAKKTALIETAL